MSELDCIKCGACCQALSSWEEPYYVRLYAEDLQEMTATQQERFTLPLVDNYGAIAGLKLKDGKCAALEGDVGCSVGCTIYKNRPSVCRSFEKGTDECLLARFEAGITFNE